MSFLRKTYRIVSDPAGFFESVREEVWLAAYGYLLVVALVNALLTPLAWALGVDGASPVNSSLGAQMQVYVYWRDALRLSGLVGYVEAVLLMLLAIHLLLAVLTLLQHLVFRLLGGQGPVLHAFKSVCYGLGPSALLGFVPVAALLVGVYDTILQTYVGPATLYRVKGGRGFVMVVLVLAGAIASYWYRIS